MAYIFRGRLCGYICDECPEPLSRVTVKLYRVRDDQNVTARAVASPKDTFVILDDEQVREKESLLIAETETDDAGNFSFELGREQKYGGEAFEIDVYCGNVPRGLKPRPGPPPPVQFSITTFQPIWRQTEDSIVGVFDYCVPARYWCAVLARRRLWVICGRLTTCEKPQQPIAGADVEAFDADWLQDDSLGAATTDADGRFHIYYTRHDFEKTIFPFINVELFGGPDVYFVVKFAGNPILTEGQAEGRKPGRENAHTCLCVHLCTDNLPHTPPEKTPHWTKVADRFNVQPDLSAPNDNFLPEGYAGSPAEAYVFGGGVMLNGNCPFKNAASPTHGLKYRFLAAEWGYSAPGPRPGALPDVSPLPAPTEPNATWKVVTAAGPTWVGDVYYNNGVNPFAKMSVYVSPDADGWIHLDGVSVTAPLAGGGTTSVVLSDDPLTGNWVRSGNLLVMDTVPLSGPHAPPAWASDRKNAGRSLTDGEKAIIHRFSVVFQVRDVATNADIFTDTRDSIIFDNSTPVGFVNIEELLSDACNPIKGLSSINVRYTVDHPHLRYFHLRIKNNATDPVHDEASMPGGDFAAGSFFFRGGASGPADPPNQSGGFAVDISGDPACAYALKLRYSTRHYQTGESGDEVLYCIE
ncbi:MAG: hypothetical protein DMF66_08285 [Acidobacteria bacterium]|nr:MAG: hypothetical protein DMF66_08285 [Acidobacteriota bacterium]